MQSDIVIRATGIGKKYDLVRGDAAPRYQTVREALALSVKNALQSLSFPRSRAVAQKSHNEGFWSLSEVSFEVKRGEVFGIIGRNGAGKSTLLKILSRITIPTAGQVEIDGRLASLLEVGTGFHPELTGRENIYLNGAILGMRRIEIAKVFDEIVAFAEVSRFLDMPVKRYSSGMYVRLAFAVAAHLDPEILILDEVLSVGDASFQKKCATKIDEIARGRNRTIILVSHGMGTITSMCNRSLLLDRGKVIAIGAPAAVIQRYLSMENETVSAVDYTDRSVGDERASLIRGEVINASGERTGSIAIDQPFMIKMTYRLNADLPDAPLANFHFRNGAGQIAFISGGKDKNATNRGEYDALCHLPSHLMNSESYTVDLALTHIGASGVQVSFYEKNALTFNITETVKSIEVERFGYSGPIPGALRPKLQWEFKSRKG